MIGKRSSRRPSGRVWGAACVGTIAAAWAIACGDSSSSGLRRLHQDAGPGSGGADSMGDSAAGGSAGSAGGRGSGGRGGGGGSTLADGGGCTQSSQCGASADCVNGACVPFTSCQNSLACGTDVCDPATHRCVQCVLPADCNTGEECVAHRCRTVTTCASDKVCTPLGQLCNTTLGRCVDCLTTADCTTLGQTCVDGACLDQVCPPSARYCDGATVKQCDAAGQVGTVVKTCAANQTCDSASADCVSRLCTPGASVCDGTRATKCDATGQGYVAGGQDCALTGLTCSAGACLSCGAGGGGQRSVAMKEVMVGTPEYIVLENRGTCPVDLAGMAMSFTTSNTTGVTFDYTLPTHTLDPGGTVFVLDSTATPQGTDILSSGNIDWQAAYGGAVLLCAGPCATVTNVVDVLSFQGGAPPPPLPAPLTFSPLTSITTANEQTASFVRVAHTGSYPAFAASDWSLGTATRPGSSGTTCPLTQPTPGTGLCTAFGLSCPYGTVTCTCSIVTLTWSCQ